MWFCIGPKLGKYWANEKYEDPTIFDVKENKTCVGQGISRMNKTKVSLLHVFFSCFLNWPNGTKSPITSHIAHKTRWLKRVELLVNLRYSDISLAHVLTKTPKCHSSNPIIQNVFYSEKETLQTLIYSHYTTAPIKILQKIYSSTLNIQIFNVESKDFRESGC